MRLFLILSKSNRQLVPRDQTAQLHDAHGDYHTPMIEQDHVLVKAMMRPGPNTPKGSRCMIIQAEDPAAVDDFIQRNPLMQYNAMEWEIHELLPNYGPPALREWFKGTFSAGHQLRPRTEGGEAPADAAPGGPSGE